MSANIYDYINPIKVSVVITLLFAIYSLSFKTRLHRFLLLILIICFSTELTNSILIYHGISIRILNSISMVFHHLLWLLVLRENISPKKTLTLFTIIFVLFSILNFFFIETTTSYNYYTFTLGAFFYVVFFIYESFHQLEKENLPFFISNNFILTTAPLLFFFGMSLLFGFKNKSITSTIVFNSMTLYNFIINLVCLVYYTLLNIYIYREKTIKK
ncbi:hypothetical protein BC748_0626 [Flavobacterium dankookense]|uniref:YhhN-like protein n=1 Tax=Flavobacterium dankookense TaxID=706186 RepID=A0A4R6QE89_9FLAO|nr:hypothetical protein BC748_0626 [Flavobacterium dankookense]